MTKINRTGQLVRPECRDKTTQLPNSFTDSMLYYAEVELSAEELAARDAKYAEAFKEALKEFASKSKLLAAISPPPAGLAKPNP